MSGTTLTPEDSGDPTGSGNVTHDWPLTDGNDAALGSSATTALDTISGNTATMSGGVSWDSDSVFGTGASFDGISGYLTTPASASASDPSYLSIWFKTKTAGGVLASVQASPLSSGGTISTGYNPFMYIGSNGLLYAEFWNGSVDPLASTSKVDDGAWHHAVLSSPYVKIPAPDGGTCPAYGCWASQETLTLDGVQQAVSGDATQVGVTWGNLDFGSGYLGGGWPNETHHLQSGNTGYLQYFNGQMADITLRYTPPPI